ncbi:glycosyltransferase family 9 protein [Candidatus Nitrosoglobus terrae]|uniref:glycosyltransferase family 9 protein n=1 Tax=Candidatus Nitrosoglobus terrae TaxID=1630141 RepID=UPI001E63FBF0|nr:glycosyltransferase family 9 protein [Candidatus Nitrosoglobus terrae]
MNPSLSSLGGILIIQPLPGIGDMVWHLPIIHAIAAHSPEGCVTVLTKPRSQADRLLKADPAIGQVLWLERNPGQHDGLLGIMRLVKLLRQQHFRQVWVLHGSSRYGFICWLAGIPERVGYGRGLQKYFLNHPIRLPPNETHGHPLDLMNRLLALSPISPVEKEPKLVIDPAAQRAVMTRYQRLPQPWIAIGIGSSEVYKQWGELNFIQLAHYLRKDAGTILIIGGSGEQAMGQRISTELNKAGIVTGEALGLSLEQVAALLALCAAYIGNDTGVLNMAAAVETPAWGLFGASPPLRHSQYIHCLIPPSGSSNMEGITPEYVITELHNSKIWRGCMM